MGIETFLLKVQILMMKNNSYLIIDKSTKKAALIDPVWQQDVIVNKAKSVQAEVAYVLLTHHHPDHIDLAETMASLYNCPVIMSEQESLYYNFQCRNLRTIKDREIILLGDSSITPLLTPGHTKGSLCYLTDNALYTGDTLFPEGCGICWGYGADPYEMYNSLMMLKKIIKPEIAVYPAHTYGIEPGETFSEILKYNAYLDFKDVNRFVAYRMRKNQNNIFSYK